MAAKHAPSQASTSAAERQPEPLNRRRALRVLGSLAAAAAGAAALNAARPEKASAYVQTEPSTNFTGPIASTGSNATSPDGATVIGTNTSGVGSSGGGVGVYGVNSTGSGTGVWGSGYWGVYGSGTGGGGVWGYSNTSIGVRGTSLSDSHGAVEGNNYSGGIGVLGTTASGVGVQGTSSSSSNNSPGVFGVNTGGGPAIVGQATGKGFGFSAVTQTGTGCFGGASGAGGTGMYAYSAVGTALTAQAPGAGAYAGFFSGSVFVTGALTVLGAKSAAVRAADGSLRRMYSLESPESWFEDFGTGKLSGGSSTVQLEPGFAALVHGDGYRVFLTPEGDSKGLYVSQKSANGFTVSESQGGTSSVSFDYRVVAKRKDIPGARLEHVDEPPVPEVPTFPTPPTPPPTPRVSAPAGH